MFGVDHDVEVDVEDTAVCVLIDSKLTDLDLIFG